jgi:hypothetical protein
MFTTFLEYATSTVVLCAVSFVAGGLLWPTVKDKIAGVPAGFRANMNTLEAKAKADVHKAIADVFAKINPAPAMTAPAMTAPANPAPATVNPAPGQ